MTEGHQQISSALRAAGVYALSVYTVESIYYHPEVQRRVVDRHASVTGEDAVTRVAAAKAAALNAVQPHAQRMSARAIEKRIRDQIDAMHPTLAQIATGAQFSITIDVAAELASEVTTFQALFTEQNLERIICRYPVRETPALTHIAVHLGFQDRHQYENAVRKLLMDDETALAFVRNLFGDLHADLNA